MLLLYSTKIILPLCTQRPLAVNNYRQYLIAKLQRKENNTKNNGFYFALERNLRSETIEKLFIFCKPCVKVIIGV